MKVSEISSIILIIKKQFTYSPKSATQYNCSLKILAFHWNANFNLKFFSKLHL